jgi:hypothetical protein
LGFQLRLQLAQAGFQLLGLLDLALVLDAAADGVEDLDEDGAGPGVYLALLDLRGDAVERGLDVFELRLRPAPAPAPSALRAVGAALLGVLWVVGVAVARVVDRDTLTGLPGARYGRAFGYLGILLPPLFRYRGVQALELGAEVEVLAREY